MFHKEENSHFTFEGFLGKKPLLFKVTSDKLLDSPSKLLCIHL